MADTNHDLASRVAMRAHQALDTLEAYRHEARRAREAAADAELPRRARDALRARYVPHDKPDLAMVRDALSALERRAHTRHTRRLAPLGTTAVAVCALLIVVVVLAAPTVQ
jgi:hypothetical protein